MDVAAAGELLVRGQAEELGHALVPAGAKRLWVDRERKGGQRGHLGPGPAAAVAAEARHRRNSRCSSSRE